MPTTTTDQILDAYEDHCMDLPGFEGTWSAFYELCELAERIIEREKAISSGERCSRSCSK